MFKTLGSLIIGGAVGYHLARSRNTQDLTAAFSETDHYKVGYEMGAKDVRNGMLMELVSGFSKIWQTERYGHTSDEDILKIVQATLEKERGENDKEGDS